MNFGIRLWIRALAPWTSGGLPGWVVNPGFSKDWSHSVCLEQLPPSQEPFSGKALVDVYLGADLVLSKTLTLPSAVGRNLDGAIKLKMRQSLPNRGEGFAWQYRVAGRQGNQITVQVAVIKKSTLSNIDAASKSQKAQIRKIALLGDSAMPPFQDNRQATDRPKWLWNMLSAIVVLCTLSTISWNEIVAARTLENTIEDLSRQRLALTENATQLKVKSLEKGVSKAAFQSDIVRFEREHKRLGILLDLTQSLENDTWISDLSFSRNNLNLSGFTSQNVSEVMTVLRSFPWSQKVTHNGPVAFDRISRTHRFELTIQLNDTLGGKP